MQPERQPELPLDTSVPISYDERFLEKYVGKEILHNPMVALTELVANSWDASAPDVWITWPNETTPFSIEDNGHGMTEQEFRRRYARLSYNRTNEQGIVVEPLVEGRKERIAYGRNGVGRFGAFAFGREFRVETSRAGARVSFTVARTTEGDALAVSKVDDSPSATQGTKIFSSSPIPISLTAEQARSELARRFLADPEFNVFVDGIRVDFEHLPDDAVDVFEVRYSDAPEHVANVRVIDLEETARTTRTRGIAFWVANRLIGTVGWKNILDGRTVAAKRLLFIVNADSLKDAVLADWSGFDPSDPNWTRFWELFQDEVRSRAHHLVKEQKEEIKRSVVATLSPVVDTLERASRERWAAFVDQVVEKCPSMSQKDITSAARVLANLEQATSRYSLLDKLAALTSNDLDKLNAIIEKWTFDGMHRVMSELEWRLKLISQFKRLTSSIDTLEVQQLQPLMEQCLWMLGPRFDSIHYTSNRSMRTVLRELFGRDDPTATPNRPDFVITPSSTLDVFSAPGYGSDGDEVAHKDIVIVELKKPMVTVSSEASAQVTKYIMELLEKQVVPAGGRIECFCLGMNVATHLNGKESATVEGLATTKFLSYDTIASRAESRTSDLYRKLKDIAPILRPTQATLGI